MTSVTSSKCCPAIKFKNGTPKPHTLEFIKEEPLLIRIDEKPYSVVMRTPGEELFHGAGFCLGEGIADSPEDIMTIGHCNDMDPNVIDIRLAPRRREKIRDILDRKIFVSQTSCGICGKEMVKDLHQILTPVKNGVTVSPDSLFGCIDELYKHQKYYPTTRGTHAAMLFGHDLKPISFSEDVGRHNALDKAIGNAFMNRKLGAANLVALSSRISYELVQKAARANLPIIISKSRPTALAIDMGRALNMTLAFCLKKSELIVVCGSDRIKGSLKKSQDQLTRPPKTGIFGKEPITGG